MDWGKERIVPLTSRPDSGQSKLPEQKPPAGPGSGSPGDDEGFEGCVWRVTEDGGIVGQGRPTGSSRAQAENTREPNGLPAGRTGSTDPEAGPLARRDNSAQVPAEPSEVPSPPGELENELPIMNWEALEIHIAGLQLQEMEKQSRGHSHRPTAAKPRSPLGRRKMDGTQRLASWERTDRSTFSCTSRFHGRMNLQLCFINDSSSESETEESAQGGSAAASPQVVPGEVPSPERGLLSRKKELESAARRELALVKRRIDLEKQKQQEDSARSKDARGRGRDPEPSDLRRMSKAQLQNLQTKVFSQIHRLNTQLMDLLETRDDLKTEQDAMLVEIGDLTH